MRRRDLLLLIAALTPLCASAVLLVVLWLDRAAPEPTLHVAHEAEALAPAGKSPATRPLEPGMISLSFRARDLDGNDISATCRVEALVRNEWFEADTFPARAGPGEHVIGLRPRQTPVRVMIGRPLENLYSVQLPSLGASLELGTLQFGPAATFKGRAALHRQWPPAEWGAGISDTPIIARGAATISQGDWVATSLTDGRLLSTAQVSGGGIRTGTPEGDERVRVNAVLQDVQGRRFPGTCVCEWRNHDGEWISSNFDHAGLASVPVGALTRFRARPSIIADAQETIDEFVALRDTARRFVITQAADLIVHVTRAGAPAVGAKLWVEQSDGVGFEMVVDAGGKVTVPLYRIAPKLICEWPERLASVHSRFIPGTELIQFARPPRAILKIDEFNDGTNEHSLELMQHTAEVDFSSWLPIMPPPDSEGHWTYALHSEHTGRHGIEMRPQESVTFRVPAGRYCLSARHGRVTRYFVGWHFSVTDEEAIKAPAPEVWPVELSSLQGYLHDMLEVRVVLAGSEVPVGFTSGVLQLSEGDYVLLNSSGKSLRFKVTAEGTVQCKAAEPAPAADGWKGRDVRLRLEQPWPGLRDIQVHLSKGVYTLPAQATQAPAGHASGYGELTARALGYECTISAVDPGLAEVVLRPKSGCALVRLPAVPLTRDATGSIRLSVDGVPRNFRLYQQRGMPLVVVPWLDPGAHKITVEAAGWTWEQQVTITAAELSELTLE